jgi:protein tyrosine/serine phosphatase
MDTIFKGRLQTRRDRMLAWTDALFVDHAVFRVIYSNFHTVVPGKLYRMSHPTPGRLAAVTRKYGLRAVINLRGLAKNGSDALSREMAARLGLAFVDAPLESRGAPQRDRVLRLIETFRTLDGPAVVHCKSGADRAGLAAGIFILMHGGTARQALSQLSLRFGHIRQSKTGVLDAFFLQYAKDAEGRKPFADWVRDEYDRESLRAGFKSGGVAGFLNDRLLARE